MMRIQMTLAALMIGLISASLYAADAPPADKPHIDVVFCIDCSGSMGPVIDTAKAKVWAIVNEIARAKPSPELRIGLIGYGNAMGPFRQFPLTNDLDEVYKNLLPFDDRLGGDEFVGVAIHKATTEMKWSEGKNVLKVIYVVGNETAHQGPKELDYTVTAPAAIARGIIVNAIYCGDYDYATAPPTWKEFAKLADGQYLEIAGKGGAVTVATPFDKELNDLSGKLNTTYVRYGEEGAQKLQQQARNDATSLGISPASGADRAAAKSAPQYNNATWDLVDARKTDKTFDITKVKEDQLPDEMKKMSVDERKAYIETKSKERDAFAKQIKELATKRDAYIKEEISKKGLDTNKAFDEAIKKTITEQAAQKGFQFDEKK